MRKDNVWKQAIALVLSAALVVGNGAPVSAAAGDTAAGNAGTTTEGTGGGSSVVENPDAYKELKFDFEDGEQTVSGDDALYIENGITFLNQCSQKVVTNDQGEEIATDENPNKSKGAEVVDGSSIPDATEADIAHGKVLKFDQGKTNEGAQTAGIDYLTTTMGALASYDYSNGVTFSFDIRPEGQRDWDYLFAFGMFGKVKYSVTGTIGFIAGYDSYDKGLVVKNDKGEPDTWQAYYPGGNWLPGNEIESGVPDPAGAWDFFGVANAERNAHKWYNIKYIYTKDGLTIVVNDVPTVTYRDANGYMEGILKNMSKGQLRIGKGLVEGFEGYIGYMDNVTIQPVHPGDHEYVDVEDSIENADCTHSGSKKKKCSMCGVIAIEVISATGHAYNHVDAKPATCAEEGNIEHYKCTNTDCGSYIISDDNGVQATSKRKVTLAKTAHDYTTTVKKATVAADGQITKTCKNCAEGIEGHSATEVIAKASNITLENSSYIYTGKAIEPKVIVKDSKNNVIDASNYTVTYANNTKVGTGTATITFKGDKYEGSVPPKNFTITEAASLTLDRSTVTLYTGKASNAVTVKATKVTGTSRTVSWTSSNTKVATVKNGKITAVGKGKADIKATANGITQIVKVTVKNPTITVKNGKKAVKKNTVTVKQKKSVKLTVSTNPKNAGITVKKLSKKDAKTASVSYKKGKLTIKGKKKGTIKVKITSGKTTTTLTVKVK